MARRPHREDPKSVALREAGALHAHPERVRDPAFAAHEFFDARDRVQVKYEMLRRHRVEGQPVADVARSFQISRQAFYAAQDAFTTQGLPGLVPQRPGPKGAHKCTEEILDFAEHWHADESAPRMEAMAEAVRHRFGATIHPRSLQRALARRKKKRRPDRPRRP
jgi:transposase